MTGDGLIETAMDRRRDISRHYAPTSRAITEVRSGYSYDELARIVKVLEQIPDARSRVSSEMRSEANIAESRCCRLQTNARGQSPTLLGPGPTACSFPEEERSSAVEGEPPLATGGNVRHPQQ